MDICSKINKRLQLTKGKVGISGNKDKQAITFQEISINANFDCIFELAYEWYDDNIIESLNRNYKDSLNKFFKRDITSGKQESLKKTIESIKPLPHKLSTTNFHIINLSIYLIVKYLQDILIDREAFRELKNKIESLIIDDTVRIEPEYCRSQIQLFNIKRGDIKRLGDLKGNKFTVKLINTTEINDSKKFYNYFGIQRFGKNGNNHLIGDKILHKDYQGAVEMIMKNSKGYEAFKGLKDENELDSILNLCDSLEKHVFKMKLRGKSDKDIVHSLKRETRMIYLHAYQSFFFNASLNKEIEKRKNEDSCIENLEDLKLPLTKFNDKMLKGGERDALSVVYNLESYFSQDGLIVSFCLQSSSYATLALREMVGQIKN